VTAPPVDPGSGIEHLLRDLTPKVLGAVVRRLGDFASAEDAVQEAVLAALTDWRQRGLPDHPGGWLFRAAWRRALDRRNSDRARSRREHELAASAPAEILPELPPEDSFVTTHDDTLALLFTCCHPALTAPSAIALTLRAVGGLTTNEIARAFLVPEATMAQRISRAKQTIVQSEIPFELPTPRERDERLDAVRHVLYLIFNEGHTSSAGPDLQRVELSREAIRLVRQLMTLVPDDPETQGLLALMLLTDSRRQARTGPAGELIPLDEQDRGLWDRAAIAEGTMLVTQAFARGTVGSYQIQAAIASLHAEATSTTTTDWSQILALYDVLLWAADNPMVRLNRAVAFAMVHGPAAGLEQLRGLDSEPALQASHRLAAVRAHLLERLGDLSAAVSHYRAAAQCAPSLSERTYLLVRAARIEGK